MLLEYLIVKLFFFTINFKYTESAREFLDHLSQWWWWWCWGGVQNDGKCWVLSIYQNFQKFHSKVKWKVHFSLVQAVYLGEPVEVVHFDWPDQNFSSFLQCTGERNAKLKGLFRLVDLV